MQVPFRVVARPTPAIPRPARRRPRVGILRLAVLVAASLLSMCALSRPAAAQGAAGKIVFESTVADPVIGSGNLIGIMNADGTNAISLTNPATIKFDGDWNPSFNHTGSKIVFVSDRTGVDEVYVMNADGTNQVKITKNSSSKAILAISEPQFSPDGTKILFSAIPLGVDNAEWNVYLMNANGSGVPIAITNALPGSGGDVAAVFTPGGSKVLFEQTNGNGCNLCEANLDGTGLVVLTTLAGTTSSPTISPDGSKIVVMANWQFLLMNADGSGRTVLFSDPFAAVPIFSPDGTKIAFTTGDDITQEVFTMNLDGTDRTQVTFGPGTSPPSSVETNTPGGWAPGSVGAPALMSLTLSPASVLPGGSSQGTVTISPAAPAGGVVLALSGSASTSVPATVTIPANATTATFPIGTATVTALTIATITATYDGISQSAILQISPDTVVVTQAEYSVSQKQLKLQATSTAASATLTAYDTATGAAIGTMTLAGGGKYQLQTTWPTALQRVTVKSSLGGSATLAVTPK